MRACTLTALAMVILSAACAKQQKYDMMSAPAICDTVPSSLGAREKSGGTLLSGVRAIADSGTVIGTVVEMGTRRPLAGAMVTLHQPTAALPTVASALVGAPTDIAGSVVLRVRDPGTYTLAVHRIGYRPRTRSMTLGAGAIDCSNRASVRAVHGLLALRSRALSSRCS